MKEEQPRRTSGGAATQGGINYQNRVAAWVCVKILGESSAAPIGPDGTAAYARFETTEPVDDLLVGTVGNRHSFVQAKRTIGLSAASDSELASVVDQFVRQYLSSRGASNPRPWAQTLDPSKDKLVLATTTESSSPLRVDLAAVLNRVRGLTTGQPLADAATNEIQRNALNILKAHVQRCWRDLVGTDPSDQDLHALLALMHINVLDVESAGLAEREALSLLETRVLARPEQSGAAWATILQLVADLSQRRSGIEQAKLRDTLEQAGISQKSPLRYESDIAALKNHTQETLRYLAHHSRISVGGAHVQVHRNVTDALRSASEPESLVTVGWPGAGKSGVLHDFAESCISEGRDVVFIAADQIGARSLGELRNEIGLQHELLDVLRNWPGDRAGLLVIDALDAARGEPASAALSRLMHTVITPKGRWRVVASIRKYDLRYNPDLRELFRGNLGSGIAPELQDAEFTNLRHLNVPLFTDEEMDQVKRQAPGVEALLRIAPLALQQLLRVPFNLRLMADILESGVDVNELKPIRTQNELLNRYWSYRVGGSGGDSRERILRKTCDLMIQARRLRTERHGLVEPGSEAALRELFSNQVLVEWQPPGASVPQRQLVAFSHHILFDFAVAQLFVPPEPAQMTRLIAEDPDLILMIRPSLVMHFQQLWESDRSSFWKLLFRICEDTQIPQIGKVIGAVVAAEAGRTVQDFEPLQRALGANTEVTRVAAERAFRYLVGALSVGPTTALVGPTAGPYCELLSILTKAPNESVAGYALTLLRTALGNGDLSSFTPQQFLMAGSAARNVLTFAWAQEKRNSFLVTNALRSVCMTFQSDTPASAALLRRAIEPEHLAKYGYEETHWIAREIKKIVDFDPELVSDIYAAVFGHDEPSTESTNMSHSRILSLTSNRRQDYDHTKWQLAEDYPQFVQRAPLAATRAVTRLIDAYVANRHRHSSGSPAIEVFNINGKQAAMVTDYSHIWDESASAHSDNEIKILDTFFRQLEDLVQLHEKGEVVDRILDILLFGNRQAVIWARLLRLGARYPAEFGSRMHSLAWTVPLLVAIDTEHDAGDFVEALFPLLSAEERELVENAIVSLPNAVDAKMKQFVERYRARLLGRLNPADLVTLQARHLLQELEAADKIPEPTPRPKIQVFSREIDERMVVEDMLGVSADKESHKNFLNVHRPVKTFYTQYSNTTPTVGEAETILPSLLALHEAIGNQSGDVDSKLLVMASGTMAGACKVIAHIDKLDCESPVGRFAQSTLLELSHHPDPEHDPDHDAAFDKSPSWSAPIARTEAAAGLISIARHGSCHGSEVLDAIQRLGRDPAPEVRYQIAAHLLSLYETAREQMWTFLKERTQSETSTAVLDALASCLGGLAGKFPDRSVELSKRIFDRTVMGSGSAEPQNRCIHTFVGLYVWQNHPASKDIVYSLVTDVQAHTRELSLVLSVLRGPLTEGATVQKTDNNSAVRARAVELFHSVTVVACNSFTDLLARSQTQAWSESDGETLREVARLVGHAATELYFASGVFRAGQNAEKEVTREEQERFYTELTPTIDRLSTIGLASMVHRLVEMLEVFVPLDPRKVFLHLSALVDSGKRDNYQYESLAIDHIVRAVERYLAEYRTLLQEDAECRTALRQILDVFVEAGWPAAQQLSYRLDDIFR